MLHLKIKIVVYTCRLYWCDCYVSWSVIIKSSSINYLAFAMPAPSIICAIKPNF